MLTLPFRLAFTIFLTLFCASRIVRRAVAGIAVSAAIVAAQNAEAFQSLAAPAQHEAGLAATVRVLAAFLGG